MAKLWKIVDRELRQDVDIKGRLFNVWRLFYETWDGKQAHIDIPENEYTVENVKVILDDIVGRHKAIAEL
ncbi:MAG: hypothetical protein DDT19_01725 [Syntrophomonadaceae bacterium]|nr:hypothetical protein [Bacillota bacterium]